MGKRVPGEHHFEQKSKKIIFYIMRKCREAKIVFCENIILKKKNGEDGFYLSRSENNELACREIIGGELAKMQSILSSDINGTDFDAIIDENDNLHIITGDKDGDVFYLRHSKERWERRCVLHAPKNSLTGTKDFFVFSQKQGLVLIYITWYKKEKVLCYQRLAEKIERPIAIAKISKERCEIFALQDTKGNISVFYIDEKSGELGRKKYIYEENKWSDFEVWETECGLSESIFAISKENKLYLCYKKRGNIAFRCIEDGQTITKEQFLTQRHNKDCSKFVLDMKEKEVRLFWGNGQKIISANRAENNKRWSRLDKKTIENAKKIEVFKFCKMGTDATYGLGYLMSDRVFIADDSKEYFERRNAYKKVSNVKNKQKIETQKKLIREQLGIGLFDKKPDEKEHKENIDLDFGRVVNMINLLQEEIKNLKNKLEESKR